MPHSLTPRQREYLDFIKTYIAENESSPRLEEIAEHFSVASPTAHNMLQTLMSKGFLYFNRDPVSGFFIRVIERAGSAEIVTEVGVTGKVDRYGELHEFPQEHGHFATVLQAAEPENLFALVLTEDIPEAWMEAGDLLICDISRAPKPNDIIIAPMGKRLFLMKVYSMTFDKDTPSLDVAQQYPVPEDLKDPDLEQKLNWTPLAYDDDTEKYFVKVAEEQQWPYVPLDMSLVVGVVLRLTRQLSY